MNESEYNAKISAQNEIDLFFNDEKRIKSRRSKILVAKNKKMTFVERIGKTVQYIPKLKDSCA